MVGRRRKLSNPPKLGLRDKLDRFEVLRNIGCIACRIDGHSVPCGQVEIHHLNTGGNAGMKRRGDAYTVPLGAWHHRAQAAISYTATQAENIWGPSLARNSKAFRDRYGKDDDLLALVDKCVALL
jgi:hypothetical protein